MTEAEWLTSDDPAAMLMWLTRGAWASASPHEWERHPSASDRKLRLWVGACRLRWPAIAARTDLSDATRLVQAVEHWRTVKSAAPASEIAALLRDLVGNPFRPVTLPRSECHECRNTRTIQVGQADCPYCPCPWLTPTVLSLAQAAFEQRGRKCRHCEDGKIRIGFGGRHGYGPPTDCPVCKGTGTIDDGTLDNARLAVLSDALEEAGCGVGRVHEYNDGGTAYWWNDAFPDEPHLTPGRAAIHPLLAHLRSPGPHFRGCWAIDLLLGKE